MTLAARFGAVVRELRAEAALTHRQLGDRLAVHSSYVSMLETGQRVPSLTTIAKLAKAFGLRPSQLLALMEKR